MKCFLNATLLTVISLGLVIPLSLCTAKPVDKTNDVGSKDGDDDGRLAGRDNQQTHSEQWGPSTTCSGCHFTTLVDPAKAVGVALHQSTGCIGEMLSTRDLQWPTAKWDFTPGGVIQVEKQTGTTGDLSLRGFLGLNGLKPGYPSHWEGGFYIEKHICSNHVEVTIDCPFFACFDGFRDVVGLEAAVDPTSASPIASGTQSQAMGVNGDVTEGQTGSEGEA